MTRQKPIQGCGTALVTPFTDGGALDESALGELVRHQIGEGIDFLVPCGSTGESAVLSMDEHLRIVDLVVKTAAGKVPVMAGAGGYNTARVVELARAVAGLGPDALLSVTPYYNKPTQEGLYRHFKAVAEAVSIPVILYNVPGRTGVNLLPDTVVRLSAIPNITGIKEASGNIDQISELAVKVPDGFRIISGDDANTIPIMSLGGVGLISVVSNETPRWMAELCRFCLEGKYAEAMRIQRKLFGLMRLNFIETSPIPVKSALAMMGKIRENYRLPLVPLKPENREKLRAELVLLKLIP
jgi:4-hydroxy-tetrahydrodipicolinate synthase